MSSWRRRPGLPPAVRAAGLCLAIAVAASVGASDGAARQRGVASETRADVLADIQRRLPAFHAVLPGHVEAWRDEWARRKRRAAEAWEVDHRRWLEKAPRISANLSRQKRRYADYLFKMARKDRARGLWGDASLWAEKALAVDPANGPFRFFLAETQARLGGRSYKAFGSYQLVTVFMPGDPRGGQGGRRHGAPRRSRARPTDPAQARLRQVRRHRSGRSAAHFPGLPALPRDGVGAGRVVRHGRRRRRPQPGAGDAGDHRASLRRRPLRGHLRRLGRLRQRRSVQAPAGNGRCAGRRSTYPVVVSPGISPTPSSTGCAPRPASHIAC